MKKIGDYIFVFFTFTLTFLPLILGVVAILWNIGFVVWYIINPKEDIKQDDKLITQTSEPRPRLPYYDDVENYYYGGDYDCPVEDGTYSADVYYTNSDTGYSAYYTLDVDVEDCRVVYIYFPNGGYLDDSMFNSDMFDEYGECTVDYGSKSFDITIDIDD